MTQAGTQARTYPAGVTSWVDIEVDDVEAAQAFYGGLFGWTFTQATPPEAPVRYLIAQLDGQDVAGIGGRADSSTAHSEVEHLRRGGRHRGGRLQGRGCRRSGDRSACRRR